MTPAVVPFDYAGPAAVADEGHLYVVEVGAGRIKVGRTAHPTKRVREHLRTSRAHGLTPGAVWVSKPHQCVSTNERALINFCLDQTGSKRSPRPEYFALDFAVVRRFAAALPMPRTDVAEFERKSAAALGFLKTVVLGGPR